MKMGSFVDFMLLVIDFILNDVRRNFDKKHNRYFKTNSKVFTNTISVCKENNEKFFEVAEDIYYFLVLKRCMKFGGDGIICYSDELNDAKYKLFENIIEKFQITDVYYNSFNGITIKLDKEIISMIKLLSIEAITLNEAEKHFFKKDDDALDNDTIIQVIYMKVTNIISTKEKDKEDMKKQKEMFTPSPCGVRETCDHDCNHCDVV